MAPVRLDGGITVKHRLRRLSLGVLVLLALAALVLRLLLAGWVTDYLNRALADMGQYRGEVADVGIHLWRGAYTIEGLKIEKADGEIPAPLLDVPLIDLSISWRALLDGGIVAEVEFIEPVLTFVDGNSRAGSQTGRGVDWRHKLEDLLPIRLNEVRVTDGTVVFRNFVSDPPVKLSATKVQASVRNLSNVRDPQGRRDATLVATAQLLDQAPLQTGMRFDPLGDFTDFGFDLKTTALDLTALNDLARAYAGIDLASGHGDFVMELEARDGELSGYAKPLLKDLKIFDWEQDIEQQRDNPFRLAWEGLAGLLTELFSNQREDQFATRVEFSGQVGNTQVSAFDAIVAILHNAFVEAYTPQFENIRQSAPKRGDAEEGSDEQARE